MQAAAALGPLDPLLFSAAQPQPPAAAPLQDPLSLLSASNVSPAAGLSAPAVPSSGLESGSGGRRFESWREMRPRILQQFTTNKKISVSVSSAAASGADEKEAAGGGLGAVKEVASVKSRLEELEEAVVAGGSGGSGASGERQQLSAKEYAAHVEQLKSRLLAAWEAGERVLSLKISIQCAKMLGDASNAGFYPSAFVLLTDILDCFGDLVFNRIKSKGVETSVPGKQPPSANSTSASALPASFTSDDVSSAAKETCHNW